MKTTRFFSVFLLIALMMSLFCVPMAAADETAPNLAPDPQILAKAAVLADPTTDDIAYALNEHQELYPASLTKIMTALVVLEAVDAGKLSLDQEITASETAFHGLSSDGSTANIKPGEIMTVRNKWLLAHPESSEAKNGAKVGLTGENIDIAKYL